MSCMLDFSLILFSICSMMWSVLIQLKCTAELLLMNNEIQWLLLHCLSSRFIAYGPCFILGKLSPK